MSLRAEIAKDPWCKSHALQWMKANPKASAGDLAVYAKWPRTTAHRFIKRAVEEGLLCTNGGTVSDEPSAQALQGELLPGLPTGGTVSANGRPRKNSSRFAEFRERFPPRRGSHRWAEAEEQYNARLKSGHTHEQIMEGLERYILFVEATDPEGKYVLMARSFVSTNLQFMEEWPSEVQRTNKNPMSLGTLR